MADHSRKDVVKMGAVNQAVVAQGQMDLSGFRIGKQRLVSKKKKASTLKKVILEEREDKKAGFDGSAGQQQPFSAGASPFTPAGGAAPPGGCAGGFAGSPAAPAGGLSLDAPEFVPLGWAFGAATAPGAAGGNEAEATESSAAPSTGTAPKAASSAPVFVPSWCVPALASSPMTPPAALGVTSGDALGDAPGADVPPVEEAAMPGPGGQAAADDCESANAGGNAGGSSHGRGGAGGAGVADAGSGAGAGAVSDGELPVAEAIERMKALQGEGKARQPTKKAKQPPCGASIEVRHYVHQVLSDDLDDKVKVMLGELVRFQERAKERDPLKYQKQKRFCVGMREAKRSVARGKAKCLICAPNLEECSAEGGLDDTVEDLIEVCRESDVPVVFALSRNRIGKAMGKNIRLSIVCVLSAEGVHQEFKQVLKLTDDLRRQWVIRQMAHFTSEDAEEARRRAEEKAQRDAERRAAKAQRDAERKAEEERLRAEAKAAKEAEKARKAAERQVEMERRRAAKVLRDQAGKEKEEADQAEAARRDAERRADERRKAAEAERVRREVAAKRSEEEERRQKEAAAAAEAAARAAAKAAVGAKDNGEDSDSDSSDSSVPLGFNSDLF